MRRLLDYLVGRSLDGDEGSLKEYAVGVAVFGRGPSFDPHNDTIVRVHARRLRSRLEEYYAGEGRVDPLLLQLPKGHYAVRWEPKPVAVSAPDDPAPSSIAVLPFATPGGGGDDEYFADGLADELIGALASLPGLHVVARTSAFQFKGRHEDIRAIGRTLGVRFAIDGSIRREGVTVRIAVTLVDTRDGFQQWSHVYDRDLGGIFKVQDEITQAIVSALRAHLGGALPSPRASAPRSVAAHDCYLKGRYFWNKATPDAVDKAIRYFREAIVLEPTYAAAHAGLADAYVFLATVESESPTQLMDAARAAASAALDLEDLAEGHAAMGTVLGIGDWDWPAAEAEFQRALQLMPSSAMTRGAYALGALAPQRRHDEAIDQLRQALRLDPLSVFLRTMLGQVLLLAGLPEEAEAEARDALELDPGYVAATLTLAWALIGRGDAATAAQVLEAAEATASAFPNWSGHFGFALAARGDRERALVVLAALLERFPGAWVPGVDVAAIYSGLGDTESALSWLRRARALRSFDVTFVADDPRFARLRADPRFALRE